jgi:hypothetical protein
MYQKPPIKKTVEKFAISEKKRYLCNQILINKHSLNITTNMKRLTLLTLLLALFCIGASAQKQQRGIVKHAQQGSLKMPAAVNSRRAADDLVTLPSGVEPEEYTLNIVYSISQPTGLKETPKVFTAKVAFVDNDVYVSGLAYYFPDAYVKGTLADGKVTFPTIQFVGEDMWGKEYLISYTTSSSGALEAKEFTMTYDAATRSLTLDDATTVSEASLADNSTVNIYTYVNSAVYTLGGVVMPDPVAVPENLSTEKYLYIATNTFSAYNDNLEVVQIIEPRQSPVVVGFDGDDLYIQGIVENLPEAWTKATKNANGQYVIPKGQYIGQLQSYTQTYDYYLASVTRNGDLGDIVLTVNADGSITNSQTIAVNGNAISQDAYCWLTNNRFKKIVEKEAIPSKPDFTFDAERSPYAGTMWYYATYFIPLLDTDGEPMLGEKVSYVFYCKKGTTAEATPVTFKAGSNYYYMLDKDLTEIAYGFTKIPDFGLHEIYFEKIGESELKTWTALGLQSIYRGNDVEHRSEIFWYDMAAFWQTQGIRNIEADKARGDGAVYNLAGQRVDKPGKGLYIVNGRKVIMK